MKKDILLMTVSGLFTILLGLGIVRWFAPQLLGIPVDLQLVQVDKKVVPFYEGVFRDEDYSSPKYLIQDPYIIRARPRQADTGEMGPNDILGFRNRNIPYAADIITIGDSQTYGNNVPIDKNWPSILQKNLQNKSAVLYNMAVGSWGAIEYLEIFSKAIRLQPKVVVVAFYSGNDSLNSFMRAYGNDRWSYLRPDPKLQKKNIPTSSKLPPPEPEVWRVAFKDGVQTAFTPKYRHKSNKNHPAVTAGYSIMAEVGRLIVSQAEKNNVQIIFTIIPSKELVYAEKVKKENLPPRLDYEELIHDELEKLTELANGLKKMKNALYVDIVGPLQQAALKPLMLYPVNVNGHPLEAGYKTIADALSFSIDTLLSPPPQGLIQIIYGPGHQTFLLAKNNQLLAFASSKIMWNNGWTFDQIQPVKLRAIANMKYGRTIDVVDPVQFGPSSFNNKFN